MKNPEEPRHINCLEMMEVFLALKTFLPAFKGHHILVYSGNTTVVAFINRWSQVTLPLLQDSEMPPPMGTSQPAFTQGSSDAGQTEPRTGHAAPG